MFKDVQQSEKLVPIEVTLKKDIHMRQEHLIRTLDLLATVYPEVKKVKKLASIIMK
jgi:hypothetical protein